MFICCSTACRATIGVAGASPTHFSCQYFISTCLMSLIQVYFSKAKTEIFLKKQTHQKVFQLFVFKTESFIIYMNFTHPHQLRICSGEAAGKHWKISGFTFLHTHVPMKKGQQKQHWLPSSHTTEYGFQMIISLHRYYKISFFHRETLHCVTSRYYPTVAHVQFSAAIHKQMFLFML